MGIWSLPMSSIDPFEIMATSSSPSSSVSCFENEPKLDVAVKVQRFHLLRIQERHPSTQNRQQRKQAGQAHLVSPSGDCVTRHEAGGGQRREISVPCAANSG